MIFDAFPTSILPKAVLASALGYAGLSYFGTGPILASRIVRADHLAACEVNVKTLTAKAGERQIAAISRPSFDVGAETAMRQAQGMLNSPFMQQLRGMSGSAGGYFGVDLGGYASNALDAFEARKREAENAYQASVKAAREATESRLAASGTVCGCIADAAIAETRTEWAIYAGTLTIYTPVQITEFGSRMANPNAAATCLPGSGDAS